MGSSTGAAAVLLLCVALSMVAASSCKSNFISREALEQSDIEPSSSRRLTDMGDDESPSFCPVDFTKIHSFPGIETNCKGAHVMPSGCCGAFKEFACPYADLMNDLNNGCARQMMDQILSTCGLPHGTFSGMCNDGGLGLACD